MKAVVSNQSTDFLGVLMDESGSCKCFCCGKVQCAEGMSFLFSLR